MKTKLLAGLLVVAMLFATVGVAMAAPDKAMGRNMITGDVTTINGNMLTVQTLAQGVVKVQTDSNTRFRQQGNPNASLSDVKVGDRIAARGQRTIDVLHASIVLLMPSNLRDAVMGKVQSINGTTIVVTKQDGSTANVATSDITSFHSKDNPNASLSDVKVGDLLQAAGVLSGNTLDAAVVRFNTPKVNNGPIAVGLIKSINGNTLTLQTPSLETLTVNLSSTTFIVKRGESGASIGSPTDLAQGAGVMVIGQRSSDGASMNAIVILIGGQRGQKQNSPQSQPSTVPQF
jgi:uncharacterized protein DUF5666